MATKEKTVQATTVDSFHRKYRPNTLSKLIGHEEVVTRLKGIARSGKIPNAILFIGPTSAGKTTMARALAAEINGVKHVDELGSGYQEINGTDKRTIEDIRSMIQMSKFKSQHKKRVIVVDEFQGILSNAPSAAALLKPLEEPSKDTLWILCTMDPSKLTTGNGKAIANRCTQFILKPHRQEDLEKQALRIIKREDMAYAKKLISTLVEHSGQEMRTLANLLESVQQFYNGLDKKPTVLKASHVSSVLSSVVSADEELAVDVMVAIYSGQYGKVHRALMDVQDGFRFITLLLQANKYLLDVQVLKGERHPKLAWWSKTNKDLSAKTKDMKLSLSTLGAVNEALVLVKGQSMSFAVQPEELLSAALFRLIKELNAK